MNRCITCRLAHCAQLLSVLCGMIFMQMALASNGLEKSFAVADSLKYITHSFVKITTVEGIVIYIDPFEANEFSDSADVVLITHEHSDHNAVSKVIQKSDCTVIRSADAIIGGAYQVFTKGSVKITAVAAYNSYHTQGQCAGYIIEFDGIILYHAGDTGKIPEMADLAVQNIDYALLPMDGTYTMTPEAATEAAAMIQAKHDIPIHTMAPPDTYSESIVARFTSPNKHVVHPGETIALVHTPSVSVGEISGLPSSFSLSQNYPNPFNPKTVISYRLPVTCKISLRIYNLLGQEVATLYEGIRPAGNYETQFDGSRLASGVYYYTLSAGNFAETKKLILLK